MFDFPQGLYSDVRIEDVFETKIAVTLGSVDEFKERRYKAAFIRVFDGDKWYYSSLSNVNNIQSELNKLAGMAKPNKDINENVIVKKLQVNKDKVIKFEKDNLTLIPKTEKFNLLKTYYDKLSAYTMIKMWNVQYIDRKIEKTIYSSKGTDIMYDNQFCGFKIGFVLAEGEKTFSESYNKGSHYFEDLKNKEKELDEYIKKCEDFLKRSVHIKPGKYTVVLSPEVAGVFAHESFGHKSEADFMVGDETMKKEWSIGKKVGASILTIVDDGHEAGNGYLPFDDEGTKTEKTYLIDKGILRGRLHSVSTAALLEEECTGNARAVNFEYEPIVRMTTTYIGTGDKTKEQLISEVKEGIFVEGLKHGSGLSTFTIAPSISYMIRDGKIAEPVDISVITGNVFETLGEIDGLSNELKLISFVTGGCGKGEQYPLPVGFGGPYVRVKNMNVQ